MPLTIMTTAPKTSSCATLAAGAVSGTKITVFMSRLAVRQAREEAALPVEAVVITFSFSSSARAVTTALARSLKEALGLRPSSFI